MGKTIMFTSGKGGSGTSTLVTNLGVVLAESGAKVLICDMNIGLRNDDIYLGVENTVLFDLGDVLSGLCSPEKAIIPCIFDGKLFLLPCTQSKDIPELDKESFAQLIDYLEKKFDFILLDCPSGFGPALNICAAVADSAVLTVTTNYSCIRGSDSICRMLRSKGLSKITFLLNLVNEKSINEEPTPTWISNIMEIPMLGMISENDEIKASANSGVPVTLTGSEDFFQFFLSIATRVVAL